jgi:hypothetical protein
MITDTLEVGRLLAYKDFVPTFIRALQVKNSFYYPFDSVLEFQSYMHLIAVSEYLHGMLKLMITLVGSVGLFR